jgi:hypothetical protein
MNDQPTNPQHNPPGFESLADLKKALKQVVHLASEEQRAALMARIGESPHPKQLAFRLLALHATGQAGSLEQIVTLLQKELTGVLVGGTVNADSFLPIGSSDDVTFWVQQQFPNTKTLDEGIKYLETEQHLWILYQILHCSGNPAKFMAAIASYTDQLEALTVAGRGGNKRRRNKKLSGFPTIAKTLIKRVPSRPTAIEPLLENLRLCRACIAASAELREELETLHVSNEKLKSELETQQASVASEQEMRSAAKSREATLAAQLMEAHDKVKSLEEALQIQAGAHGAEMVGAVAEAITALRRKMLPELENIRLYADRAEPNTTAIVRKAQELKQFVTDFPKA